MTAGPKTARPRPLRVGLTGGIASGKSTVAAEFARLGAPVIDADRIARELTQPPSALLEEIARRFGAQTLERVGAPLRRDDGSLDRAALRKLVFEDAALRGELEALLHPAIRAAMERQGEQAGGAYQIYVVPLLIETAGAGRYDRVLVVDCPEALQLARLRARDGIDEAQARAMLAAQASREARLAAAHDIVRNDATLEALASQVAALDQRYRALAPTARTDRGI